MSNQNFYPPNLQQHSLFRGAVNHLQPGKRWIIITFDGTCIVTAAAFQYSKIWGLYVTGNVENEKLSVFQKIEENFKTDKEKTKNYVEFANCPPLNISFLDWVQSAADTAQKAIHQLSQGKKCMVIFLSSHPLWAKPDRIVKIYEKLRLNSADYPDLTLVSDVEKRGNQELKQGQVPKSPAVDANYYLMVIKKNQPGFQLARECIFQAGTPLEFSPNSRKNKSRDLEIAPFIQNSNQYHLFITRESDTKHSLVSVTRVVTDKKKLKLALCFEPVAENPELLIQEAREITPLQDINSIPTIFIKSHQPPLQVAVLFDATMPEDQVEPVKEKLIAMAQTIAAAHSTAQFGLAVYGDYSDKLGKADFEINNAVPTEFFPISQWVKVFKEQVKRVKPADFMSAMDQGLIRMELFPWDNQAKKYLVLIFSSPPHPHKEPNRPVSRLPFTHAKKNWNQLLEKFKIKYHINISVVYIPKKAKMEEIQQEIKFTCSRMKTFDFKGQGLHRIDEIPSPILKEVEMQYYLEPDTYHIPIIPGENQ